MQRDEYAISASFATSGNGIRYSRAAALWQIACNPQDCTSRDILLGMTDYYDAFIRDKMHCHIWNPKRRPGYMGEDDTVDTFSKGFKSRRIFDPFGNNDDFIPLAPDARPCKEPIEPNLPPLPHGDLDFDELSKLAADSRKEGIGRGQMPIVGAEMPNFPDCTEPHIHARRHAGAMDTTHRCDG